MKITFLVTRSDTIGGSHIHVRDLGIALQRDGHDVHVVIGGDGPIIRHFEDSGLNVVSVPSLKRNISPIDDIRAYFDIKKILTALRPDLVSTHSSKAGFLGRLAASNAGIPVLFTAHGWSFTSGKSSFARYIYKILEKSVAPKTDYIITVSDYDKKLALINLPISPAKIQTVHNGMGDIAPNLCADPGSDENGYVNIVKVARFDQQKNHRDFLFSVSELENIQIHFVGDGPLMEDIRVLTNDLGIENRTVFHGRINNVDKVLSVANIFVLISNWEGFPRSTIEAMRAGLPVVVSNVGGAAEAVKHGVNGFVVEKGDREMIRKYITMLCKDSKMRSKMGIKARKNYEKHLSFNRMYKETVDIYEKITSG